MNIFLWMIYLLFGIIIVAPLIQGDLFKVDKKYHNFRYVSIVLLLWWIIDFLRLITTNGVMLYYLTTLLYPTVFLFVVVFYIAIKKHFDSKINILTYILLIGFFALDFGLAMTNNLHQLFFIGEPSLQMVFEDTRTLSMNTFFFFHTGMSYAFLITIIFYIMKHITKRMRINQDIYPFLFIILSIMIGITLNLFHVFVYTFHLDPTLLTIIIVISVLYYVFYIRDLKLLLGFNRNRFILDHLREKYVIVDELGYVVDASKEFTHQFGVNLDQQISYDELLHKIKETAVLFEEEEDVLNKYSDDKIFLNTLVKPIYLPFYKHSGTFYLYFDQTANLKYIYDMNYIKTHDLMTKIYNRNFLEDIRDNLDDNNTPYQITMFDLDGLKLFNDYLGHHQGDELLKRFASQLDSVTEKEDVYPIRLGGDEFIVLAVNQSKTYINNMIAALNKLNNSLPFMEKIQFSYAVTERNSELNSMKLVLASVDQKMYQMKQDKDNYKELLEKELIKQKQDK